MQKATIHPVQPGRPAINVQAVSDKQWPQVLDLLEAVYVGDGFTSPEAAGLLFRRETLESAGCLLVATDQQTVLGAVLLLHRGSSLKQIALEDEAEFRLLAVAHHARGRGVGELLVRQCLQLSSRKPLAARALVLWTRPQMIAAQRLYERLGFRRTPERDAQLPTLPPDSPPLERWVYCHSLDI